VEQSSQHSPLPVRPSNPTFSRGLMAKDTPCKTEGKSGAYLMTRSSTLMRLSDGSLVDGQYAGGRLLSMTVGGSCGNSRYSTTRSMELGRSERFNKVRSTREAYFRSSSSCVTKFDALGRCCRHRRVSGLTHSACPIDTGERGQLSLALHISINSPGGECHSTCDCQACQPS